ncbi:polysaccharide deacetylase family protein [Hydrogenobacter thermophilus]|uniref:polysaccharide deacetylase family protein n=1 Tax=Hydrogenobacter thermophilus TaxID=940 RepID=UPI0030FAC078
MILILLYHKVVKYPTFDLWWKTFDIQLYILKRFFRLITLDDVIEYFRIGKFPKSPSVAITFDDGYADNYIYAYPILKKHKLKATLFIASSRILRIERKRKNLEDYWKGEVSLRELYDPKNMWEANYEFLKYGKSDDFLTQEELLSMKDVFDIGWHSKYHTKDFYEEKLLDLCDGKNFHWSLYHAYAEEPKMGFPIFPMRGSLSVRKGKLKEEVKAFLKSLNKDFFKMSGWKRELKNDLLSRFDKLLEFEKEEERMARTIREVEESLSELEAITGEKILHSAYPFGDYDIFLRKELSKRFISAFTTEKRLVKPQDDTYLLPRVTVPKDMWSFLAILGKFLKSFRNL